MSKRKKDQDNSNDETNDNKLDKTTEVPASTAPASKKRKVVEDLSKVEVKTLDDLISLANKYNPAKEYSINMEKLHKLLPSLMKLKNIIGMSSVKDSIVGQIIYFLNEFDNEKSDMMHTVIQGSPGVGKTMLGKIIGELYYYLGVIKPKPKPESSVRARRKTISRADYNEEDLDDELDEYNEFISAVLNSNRKRVRIIPETKEKEKEKEPFNFKIVKRSDLVGRYLGETAIKTQKVLDDIEGGVLFIDEAYSLGNEEGRDSFAKECIDTINQNLSEKKDSLLCIIAGYKNSLDECFFAYNEGLRRRFPFVYTIEKYTAEELCLIFKKMVGELGWTADEVPAKFFEENYKYFENMGGDVETLLFMTKIEHGKRVLFKPEDKKKINKTDIENAFKLFKLNKEAKSEDMDETWKTLYN